MSPWRCCWIPVPGRLFPLLVLLLSCSHISAFNVAAVVLLVMQIAIVCSCSVVIPGCYCFAPPITVLYYFTLLLVCCHYSRVLLFSITIARTVAHPRAALSRGFSFAGCWQDVYRCYRLRERRLPQGKPLALQVYTKLLAYWDFCFNNMHIVCTAVSRIQVYCKISLQSGT